MTLTTAIQRLHPDPASQSAVLEVQGLSVDFSIRNGMFRAVDDVSFVLERGKTLCLVGESGSGKSVTARAILRIAAPGRITAGRILLHQAGSQGGQAIDIASLSPDSPVIRGIRGRAISMIFQEPLSSLSPLHRIGWQIGEVLAIHSKLGREERRQRVIELLTQVEIPRPEQTIDRYPFELSGGMRQRVMIAMALACNPEILIADEPTTALDVTTQAEILDLIRGLQRRYGMAVLFITHDMGVVAEIADEVAIMRRGKLVESGPVRQIFSRPREPYSQALIGSVLRLQKPREVDAGSGSTPAAAPILTVRALGKRFEPRRSLFGKAPDPINALVDVDLELHEAECLGIVGESGSGKTTLGRCIMRLMQPSSGKVVYRRRDGTETDLADLDTPALRRVYREIRMIFQDPFGSLNPRLTVRQAIAEPLLINRTIPREKIPGRVADLMETVGLDPGAMERYPHAFSGGQRQRICIARALALDPRIIIADEATSALDVTIRLQILDLLLSLRERMKLSFIFISHDMSVIRYFCDRVGVMYKGRLVEIGTSEQICTRPSHAYTRALLSAVPVPDPARRSIASRHRYVEALAPASNAPPAVSATFPSGVQKR